MSTRTPNKSHWNDLINHKPSTSPLYHNYMTRWTSPTWKDTIKEIWNCTGKKILQKQTKESSHT